jgi:hypothetical protein
LQTVIEWRRRRLLDGKCACASPPNELGERIEVSDTGLMEEVAKICAGKHAVANERRNLSGDCITLFRQRLLTGRERERESHRELAHARIVRGFDRALNERELFAAVCRGSESRRDRRVDHVRIASTESGEDRPGDARARRIVEPWIGEGEIREAKWTSQAKPKPLEISEGDRIDGVGSITIGSGTLENKQRVVVRGRAVHVYRRVATDVRARAEPAIRRNDGKQARCE